MMTEPKRLFFVRTPLQALLVAAVRVQAPGRDTIVYDPTSGSDRHRLYFDRLFGEKHVFIDYRPWRSQLATELSVYARLPRWVGTLRFDECHIGSIGSLVFGLLLRRSPSARIGTFDDGTFNLAAEYFFDWLEREAPRRRAIKALLGVKQNRTMYDESIVHHTIFRKDLALFPCDKLKPVDLFAPLSSGSRPIRVLLGTPGHLFDAAAQAEYARIRRVLPHDVFLPHPAEAAEAANLTQLPEAEEVLSRARGQIAEEVITQLCAIGFAPQVYGFGSTTLVNVSKSLETFNIIIPSMNAARADLMATLGVPAIASSKFAEGLRPETKK